MGVGKVKSARRLLNLVKIKDDEEKSGGLFLRFIGRVNVVERDI
jgi:hypothetical protein